METLTPLIIEAATKTQSTEKAIAAGTEFLLRKQGDDGAWRDFYLGVGVGSQWVTGYVCHMTANLFGMNQAHQRAIEWLQATVKPGGGWGFNEAVPADGDSTANALLCMRAFPEQFTEQLQRDTAVFLLTYFTHNTLGGCSTYVPIPEEKQTVETSMIRSGSGWCAAHPSVTAMALEALTGFVEPVPENKTIHLATEYLSSVQNTKGYWPAYWWDGYMYATNRAAKVFCILGDLEKVNKAIEWTSERILPDGGWNNGVAGTSSAFHTALAVQTISLLPSAPLAEECLQKGMNWLCRHQQESGEWKSSLPLMHITNPRVHQPWLHQKNTAMGFVADRENVFTTATVLNALHSTKQSLNECY